MTSESIDSYLSPNCELNILIFGESGVGKSSLINQVYDKIVVKSSSQAVGCTIENTKVTGTLKDWPHLSFNLYDTVGLSESADGSVPTAKAFVQLIKLAYAIPNGINLLICCAEKGRLSSERFKANYRILKEELCENRIPCLLVITRCDGDYPLNEWWTDNKETVREDLKFNFVDGVCVSTLKATKRKPDDILQDYIESRRTVIETIIKHALPKPILIDAWSRKVIIAARLLYNSVAKWLSWLGVHQTSLRPELVNMFTELNYSSESAKVATDRLLEELSKKDLVTPYREVDA